MRIFQSEFGYAYSSYSFGYTVYAKREAGDQLNEIYNQGFLPYSGSPDVQSIFYMARSVRVPLQSFEPNSENRRIDRKFEGQLTRRKIAKTDFLITDPLFEQFCLAYFSGRHGDTVMSIERFRYILNHDACTHVVEYKQDNKIVGYVFLGDDNHMTHFWYSFYDLSLVNQSLGLYLMLDAIRSAQTEGKQHVYLGTAYGSKGLYKTNFDGLEFWNGKEWSNNKKLLKELCRSDDSRTVSLIDIWKQSLNKF